MNRLVSSPLHSGTELRYTLITVYTRRTHNVNERRIRSDCGLIAVACAGLAASRVSLDTIMTPLAAVCDNVTS